MAAAASAAAMILGSCGTAAKADDADEGGGLRIEVTAGPEWLHDFPLFPGIKTKNSPQYAIWLEDADGNFIANIAVTEKIAKEKWAFNGGNRRIEALPLWSHRQGVVYSDGLMVPGSEEPLPDAVTAASAKTDFSLCAYPDEDSLPENCVIYAEFNHSIDFNDRWPADAAPGSDGYSGGEYGSGQPAVVYSAEFSPAELAEAGSVSLKLTGRSSADGSDGRLYTDTCGMTTALDIVAEVVLSAGRVLKK